MAMDGGDRIDSGDSSNAIEGKALNGDLIGQVLKSRYRVERLLRGGGSAHADGSVVAHATQVATVGKAAKAAKATGASDVYAGVDLKGGRIAIKAMPVTRMPDQAARSRWVQRAYLSNAVGHASAVSVLDDGTTEDGSAFVIMELLEAHSIEQLRMERGGRLPTRLVCGIGDQCLEMLESAHAQHVVHGELNGDNLFWTRSGQLKALGFAFTTHTEDAEHSEFVKRDLSDVAAMLFLLLSGESYQTRRAEQIEQPELPISELLPDVPQTICVVLDRALAPAAGAGERWSSARQMRAALQLAFASALGSPIDQVMQPMASHRGAPPPPWALLTVAVVGSAVLAWTAVWPSPHAHDAAKREQARQAVSQQEESAQRVVLPETSVSAVTAKTTTTDSASPASSVIAEAEASVAQDLDLAPDAASAQAETPHLETGGPVRGASLPALRKQISLHRMGVSSKTNALGSQDVHDALCTDLEERHKQGNLSPEAKRLWNTRCASPAHP